MNQVLFGFLFYFVWIFYGWKKVYHGACPFWFAFWLGAGVLPVSFLAQVHQILLCYGMWGIMFAVFYQDLTTYYFSAWWLLAGAVFVMLGLAYQNLDISSRLAGMVFGLGCLVFVRMKTMGAADVWVMMIFGFVLGYRRMFVCLLASSLMGLLWGIILRVCHKEDAKAMIPFCCCLVLGFMLSLIKGFTLYSLIIGL